MTPFVEYFKLHGEFSDPKYYGDQLRAFPDEPIDICKVIHGLIIHPFLTSEYGVEVDGDRANTEQQARSVVEILDNICRIKKAPLTQARSPDQRTVGTCRNFSLLLCSILRCKGIPARIRCGFATYFEQGWYEDHWICEYWSDTERGWIRVDPQLDDLQVQLLRIDFDPGDVPIDVFLYAGEAWVMCRRGRADPATFGVLDLSGLGFIKGNIVRDILALNKIETLPWDLGWGILDKNYLQDVDRGELGYIDRLARCSANSLVHLAHSFFHDDEKIRFPEGWSLSMAPTIAQLNDESYRM